MSVIVESTGDVGLPAPDGVVFVAPGTGLAAATGDVVCVLDDHDRPAADWLAAVAEAAADTRADVIKWGTIRLRPDGIIDDVVIPPSSGRVGRTVRSGYAMSRATAGAGGTVSPHVRACGIPRLPMRRCAPGAASPDPSSLTFPFRPVATGDDRVSERPEVPAVSVVLPIHNSAATLEEQLTALAAQDYDGDWELIVVDNGSTDRSPHLAADMADRFADCRVVSATRVKNLGYARNAGVRVARGDLLLFCDADDVADSGWLRAMVEASRGSDLIGGALDCSRLSPDQLEEQPVPLPEQQDFLPFARGANCAAWRDVLNYVGGWGEHFQGGGEDVDLSWRVQLSGYRLVYAPEARMEYRLRSTLRGVARQKWRYGLSGAALYRTYRYAGYQRRSGRAVAHSWLWLALHLPDLARPGTDRRRWVRYAARLAGFTAGSLHHRVAFL